VPLTVGPRAKRSGRSRHHRTTLASAPGYRRRRGQPPPRRSRRCRHRRPHAAPQAQDRRQEAARRFQRAPTATRSSRAGAALRSGGPGRAGLRCPMGPRGLDGTLGLAFRVCSLFVLQAVSRVKSRHLSSLRLRHSGADTEASLDLGSNVIELRFWEIRRPRRRWVCLTDAKQARRPRRGFFCDFWSPLRLQDSNNG